MALISGMFNDDLLTPFLRDPILAAALVPSERSRDKRGPVTTGMKIDVLEKPDKFEILADLPGVEKQNVQVDVDHDLLNISVSQKSEEKEEKSEEGWRWHRVERSANFARRSVRLPDTADLNRVDAKLENGVLALSVPKKAKEEAPVKRIAIN